MKLMKSKKFWVVFILFSALATGAYLYRDHIPGFGKSGKSGHNHAKAQVMYTCSMHPQVMKSEPGPCPICGMPMTPMKMSMDEHEDMEPSDSTSGNKDHSKHSANKMADASALKIRLSSAVIQKMGVITDLAVKKKIAREIRSVAHIDYNEKTQVLINSRVEGWIEKLYARYTGQTVRRGQALAGIFSPELVSTQQEYLSLYKRFKAGQNSALAKDQAELLAASRQRLLYWNISRAQIVHLEKTQKVSRLLTIHSPYSGVVIKKHIKEGEHIKAGMDLFEIADLNTVWAYVHIPEQDIPFVKLNMKADMIVAQYSGRKFPGHVSFIFPFMEKETRDLKIRLSFRNPGFHLKPGMFSTVVLKQAVASEQIVIPESAVIRSGTRELVFIYKGKGIFIPRIVKLGVTDGEGHIQILEGVAENEAVATSGQFLLDSESKLQEAVRKMRAAGVKGKAPGGHNH